MEVDFTQYYIFLRRDCEVTNLILMGRTCSEGDKKSFGIFCHYKKSKVFHYPNGKEVGMEVLKLYPTNVLCRGGDSKIKTATTGKRKRVVTNSVLEEGVKEIFMLSSEEVLNTPNTAENIKFVEVVSSMRIKRCGSAGFQIPSSNELSDCMVQDEMKEGKDQTRESFINFVVDCPECPIFLKCADVTENFYTANAMKPSLEGVMEEVGVNNVVQVITYTKLECMVQVGKKLKEKHKGIFWTVCVFDCINLTMECMVQVGKN